MCVNDHKREPFPGVPFPSYGADTDRWFVFREWYFGSTCVAVRRLFLHSKISNAAEYLQAGGWEYWHRVYHARLAAAQEAYRVQRGSYNTSVTPVSTSPVTGTCWCW